MHDAQHLCLTVCTSDPEHAGVMALCTPDVILPEPFYWLWKAILVTDSHLFVAGRGRGRAKRGRQQNDAQGGRAANWARGARGGRGGDRAIAAGRGRGRGSLGSAHGGRASSDGARGRGGRGRGGRAGRPSRAVDVIPAPFALSLEQLSAARARARAVWSEGWLLKAIRESNMRHWASKPSYLKTHDWRLMCGLLGKYLLAGFLSQQVRQAVFNMLELMDRLLANKFKAAELAQLEADVKEGICSPEQSVPDCASGILRHLILHVAERIASLGPPWASAMWAWEWLWGRVIQWMKQRTYPETTIMHGYVAFRAAIQR